MKPSWKWLRLVAHAWYYILEECGAATGLTWRLRPRGVYSPELARLLLRGEAPRPRHEALMCAKKLVNSLCGVGEGECWPKLIAYARTRALAQLGIIEGEPMAPLVLREKPITPAQRA